MYWPPRRDAAKWVNLDAGFAASREKNTTGLQGYRIGSGLSIIKTGVCVGLISEGGAQLVSRFVRRKKGWGAEGTSPASSRTRTAVKRIAMQR